MHRIRRANWQAAGRENKRPAPCGAGQYEESVYLPGNQNSVVHFTDHVRGL